MPDKTRLDDLCRSERYFTATLLPALLMRDPRKDVVDFVTWMSEQCQIDAKAHDGEPVSMLPSSPAKHVEIITELNVKRDLAFYQPGCLSELVEMPSVRTAHDMGTGRQAVPDVVLLLDDLLVVIEGKFFVRGVTQTTLNHQLLEQKEEIAIMLEYLGEKVCRVAHVYLGPSDLGDLECDGTVTWSQVHKYATEFLGPDHYAVQRLGAAVVRYESERREAKGKNYETTVGYEELLEWCRADGSKILVGLDGGEAAVKGKSSQYLEQRIYKVDYVDAKGGRKDPKNWIAGERMLELLTSR